MTDNAILEAWRQEVRDQECVITERLMTFPPRGKSYEALVPDTLDLAERGAMALNCLTQSIAPELDASIYEATHFDANPAFMTTSGTNIDVSKTVEALPQVRLMSGSTKDLDIERVLMLRVMAQSWEDGVFYTAPAAGRDWITPEFSEVANMVVIGRLLHGMLCWHQYNGDPLWMEHARKTYVTIRDKLIRYDRSGNAFFPPMTGWGYLPKAGYPPGMPDSGAGGSFRSAGAAILGYNLLGVAKYAAMTQDPEAAELARRMANSLRSTEFWERGWGFIETPGIVPEDRAHFGGHFHTNMMALRGLLEYAIMANDADTREYVRSGYEFARCYGIADIGYAPEDFKSANGEGCCAADLVILAVRLSEAGVGDYWDDADRCIRNQFTEWQFVDKEQLERCSAASPAHEAVPPGQTDIRAIERNIGSFCGNPFVTDYPRPWNGLCCNQNGAQALYQAWEGIVQDAGNGAAQVNLLLNRASPLLDVDSYLPYEGKAVVKNKAARTVYVRVPNWVSRKAVRSHIDGGSVPNQWLGNYLAFEGVRPGTEITLKFPMVERTIQRTLGATGVTYTIDLRGNTVMNISLRDEEAPQGISNGALVLSRPMKLTAATVDERDVQVSVDAGGDQLCGLLLRYKGDWDYLLATYHPFREVIYFLANKAGMESFVGAQVNAPGLGSEISLTARLAGLDASFTVTDGTRTYTTTVTLPETHNTAGAVGVYVSVHTRSRQWYKNFRVTGEDGKTLFEDRFDGPDGPPPGWRGARLESNYLFYQRDHMRGSKAPMVRKARYAPDLVIHP